MVQLTRDVLALRNQQDLVMRPRAVRQIAEAAWFKELGQSMLVTATCELARNTIILGGGGEALWELVEFGEKSPLSSPSVTAGRESRIWTWP